MFVLAGLSWLFFSIQGRLKRIEDLESVRVWVQEIEDATAPLSLVDSPAPFLIRQAKELERTLDNPPRALADSLDSEIPVVPDAKWREAVNCSAIARLKLAGSILARRQSGGEATVLDRELDKVGNLHRTAIRLFPEIVNTPGYVLQTSRLEGLRGNLEEAARIRDRANMLPVREHDDRILVAHERLMEGNTDSAIRLLEQAINDDGDDFEAWLLLGNSWDIAGNAARAEACFSVCLGINPDSPTARYHRALARNELGDLDGARDDYSQAIRNEPGEPVYYANRALVEMAGENWEAAERDLSRAIELNDSSTRLRYLRYQVRQALGDNEGAQSDFAQFLRQEPDDEESRLVRGAILLQQGDRAGALKEFDRAISHNPLNAVAWNNKATVEDLGGNTDNAIAAMAEVVRLQPDNAVALATRGVLYARNGDRPSAHADAEGALKLDSSPDICYRVAGIFALTSRTMPEDRIRAIALVAKAALDQPQLVLDYLDSDPDIAPVIDEPEMKVLRKALESIRIMSGTGSVDSVSNEEHDQ